MKYSFDKNLVVATAETAEESLQLLRLWRTETKTIRVVAKRRKYKHRVACTTCGKKFKRITMHQTLTGHS